MGLSEAPCSLQMERDGVPSASVSAKAGCALSLRLALERRRTTRATSSSPVLPSAPTSTRWRSGGCNVASAIAQRPDESLSASRCSGTCAAAFCAPEESQSQTCSEFTRSASRSLAMSSAGTPLTSLNQSHSVAWIRARRTHPRFARATGHHQARFWSSRLTE